MNSKVTFDQGKITLKKSIPRGQICFLLVFDLPIMIWLWASQQILPSQYSDDVVEFCGIDALLWLRINFTASAVFNFYTILFTLLFTKPSPGGSQQAALAAEGCKYTLISSIYALFAMSWLLYGYILQVAGGNECGAKSETETMNLFMFVWLCITMPFVFLALSCCILCGGTACINKIQGKESMAQTYHRTLTAHS